VIYNMSKIATEESESYNEIIIHLLNHKLAMNLRVVELKVFSA